jgi:hypothetical protein
MDLGKIGRGDVDWIGLAQDRDKWRAFVNSTMNLRFPQNADKISQLLAFRVVISSIDLVTQFDSLLVPYTYGAW